MARFIITAHTGRLHVKFVLLIFPLQPLFLQLKRLAEILLVYLDGRHVRHKNLTSEKLQGIPLYGGISFFPSRIFGFLQIFSIFLQIFGSSLCGVRKNAHARAHTKSLSLSLSLSLFSVTKHLILQDFFRKKKKKRKKEKKLSKVRICTRSAASMETN